MTQPRRPSRPSWTERPPVDWAERQAKAIADELKKLRGRNSAQWLADRTKELGYEVTRSVISDLENGRRRYVTTAELVILAAALNTSPVNIVYPGPYDSRVEVVPNSEDVTEYVAAEWFSGNDTYIRGDELGPAGDRGDEWEQWALNVEKLKLWRELEDLVIQREQIDDQPKFLAMANKQIKSISDRLRRIGGAAADPDIVMDQLHPEPMLVMPDDA